MYYKILIDTTTSITHHSILTTYSQFLWLPQICSDYNYFEGKATAVKDFIQACGYLDALLNKGLQKNSIEISTGNEALRPPAEQDSTESRVPLVLTYNQFNTGMRQILLDNFEILLSDPVTNTISSKLPLVFYWRDRNLREYQVQSAEKSDTGAKHCLPTSSLVNVPTHYIS